jgi:glutathione S-transferase
MATPPTLVVLPVSPWSERARWALDHHRVSYRTVRHAPFIGELRLRRMIGPHARPATVPVLIDGDNVLADSWDIALYADRIGRGEPLIALHREAEVRTYAELGERISSHTRAMLLPELIKSPQALDENAPPPIPARVRALLRPVMRVGTRWFARKYGIDRSDRAQCERTMREGFEQLRSALQQGGGPYLLGKFSYADIVMATALQGIAPVADEYIRLGPATRRIWTQPQLAHEYRDLVEWRDDLYRNHRRPDAAEPVSAA